MAHRLRDAGQGEQIDEQAPRAQVNDTRVGAPQESMAGQLSEGWGGQERTN